MIIVSNASPLISLAKINRLELLRKLFTEIIIPPAVYEEVVVQGKNKPGSETINKVNWILTHRIESLSEVEALRKTYHLGQGEAEVIILAEQLLADWLILDELPARKAALQRKQKVIGTIGIILLAKDQGFIKQVKTILDELINLGFHLSDSTYAEVLIKAGEM